MPQKEDDNSRGFCLDLFTPQDQVSQIYWSFVDHISQGHRMNPKKRKICNYLSWQKDNVSNQLWNTKKSQRIKKKKLKMNAVVTFQFYAKMKVLSIIQVWFTGRSDLEKMVLFFNVNLLATSTIFKFTVKSFVTFWFDKFEIGSL